MHCSTRQNRVSDVDACKRVHEAFDLINIYVFDIKINQINSWQRSGNNTRKAILTKNIYNFEYKYLEMLLNDNRHMNGSKKKSVLYVETSINLQKQFYILREHL